MSTLLELGATATGPVIDGPTWTSESRIRRLRPPQVATGTVHGIYPQAPRVVAVLTRGGDLVHITVGSRR